MKFRDDARLDTSQIRDRRKKNGQRVVSNEPTPEPMPGPSPLLYALKSAAKAKEDMAKTDEEILEELRTRIRNANARTQSAAQGTSVQVAGQAPKRTVPLQELPTAKSNASPGGLRGVLNKLTTPLIDIPDLPGPLEIVEQGVEGLTSPLGVASLALIPVTGGSSLGLTGLGGTAARLGTRAAAEALVGGAAGVAAGEVSERLPENTPGAVRLAATLGAGALAGGGAAAGVNRLGRNTAAALARSAAEAKGVTSDAAAELVEALQQTRRLSRNEKNALRQEFAQTAATRGRQAELEVLNSVSPNLPAAQRDFRAIEAQAKLRGAEESGRAFSAPDFAAPAVRPQAAQQLSREAADYYVARGMPQEASQARAALVDVFAGKLPTHNELRLLEDVFGAGFTKALRLHRNTGTKVLEALNYPRALVATFDVSAPGRQGIMLAAANPKEFFGSIGPMLRSFTDKGYANQLRNELRGIGTTDDAFKAAARADRAGVAATTGRYAGKEEAFFGSGLGIGKKGNEVRNALFGDNQSALSRTMEASERSYSLFLDLVRRKVFDKTVKGWDEAGLANPIREQTLANFLNVATGRAPVKVLEGNLGQIMNAGFFAPGWFLSRFATPAYLFNSDPVIREIARKNLGAFMAAGGSGLALISLAAKAGYLPDASVEIDPRSSDFGKIKIGNTRYDYWGGYQQIARAAWQAATGEKKSPTSGRVSDKNRLETVLEFVQSKLSPAAGFGVDVLKGETFTGDEITTSPESVFDQATQRLLPLFIQDMMESAQQGGNLFAPIPTAFGISTSTFQSLGEVKDNVTAELFPGKTSYRDLTAVQRDAVDQSPKVLAKVQEFEGKAGDSYVDSLRQYEDERLTNQRLFMGKLEAGMFTDRSQFADAMEENELIAAVSRDRARETFGVQDVEPTSALQVALNSYYDLYDAADWGADEGVKTGQINWDRFEELRRDLYKDLTQEQIDFIEERPRADADPAVEWYFNDKRYINDSGYYDTIDDAFNRLQGPASRLGVTSMTELRRLQAAAEASNDYSTLRATTSLIRRIENIASRAKERMRKRDPKLDRALYEVGRVTKLLTPAAKRMGVYTDSSME